MNRRDSHLIFVSLFVLIVMGLGLATLSPKAPRFSVIVQIFVFLLAVATYVLIKHRESRKLRERVIDERIQISTLQARVNEISSILKVTTRVSSIGSLDATLRLILGQAAQLLCADHGFLLLKGRHERCLAYSRYRKPGNNKEGDDVQSLETAPECLKEIRNSVLRKGKAVLLNDSKMLALAFGKKHHEGILPNGIPASFVAAPLQAFGKSFGVVLMMIDKKSRQRPFSRHHRNLLRILANNASCAMRNLTLYEKIRFKNEKLRQSMEFQKRAQRKLLEAEKLSAMREMVSGVAHELNNPLTSILGYIQLLERTELEEASEKYTRIVFEEAVRCRNIVQDFLAFARKEEPDLTLIDANDLVRRTLTVHRHSLRDAKIEVETNLAEDLPRLVGDPHHLQQALLNTLKTVQAVVEEDPESELARITLSTWATNESVMIRLHGTGPGIPEERLEHIFDPFFMTDDGTKGAGLSLCVARAILLDHGGDIEIASGSQLGVTTTIKIQAQRGAKSETGLLPEKAPDHLPAVAHPTSSFVDRLHALLIVDKDTLSTIQEAVREEPIDLDILDHQDQLAKRVTIRSYDLVVIDVDCMNPSLLDELSPLSAWCPHIVLHPRTEPLAIHDFPSEDNHFHILKPFDKEDFHQVVTRALQTSKSQIG